MKPWERTGACQLVVRAPAAKVCPVRLDIPRMLLAVRDEGRMEQPRAIRIAMRAFAWAATRPRIYRAAAPRSGGCGRPQPVWLDRSPARTGGGMDRVARDLRACGQEFPRIGGASEGRRRAGRHERARSDPESGPRRCAGRVGFHLSTPTRSPAARILAGPRDRCLSRRRLTTCSRVFCTRPRRSGVVHHVESSAADVRARVAGSMEGEDVFAWDAESFPYEARPLLSSAMTGRDARASRHRPRSASPGATRRLRGNRVSSVVLSGPHAARGTLSCLPST